LSLDVVKYKPIYSCAAAAAGQCVLRHAML
jgi:hypothetical protein